MATFQDGNVRRATSNSRDAAKRSAENRRCPKCKRKSALKHISEDEWFGSVCRWPDCDYVSRIDRASLASMRDVPIEELRDRPREEN